MGFEVSRVDWGVVIVPGDQERRGFHCGEGNTNVFHKVENERRGISVGGGERAGTLGLPRLVTQLMIVGDDWASTSRSFDRGLDFWIWVMGGVTSAESAALKSIINGSMEVEQSRK